MIMFLFHHGFSFHSNGNCDLKGKVLSYQMKAKPAIADPECVGRYTSVPLFTSLKNSSSKIDLTSCGRRVAAPSL